MTLPDERYYSLSLLYRQVSRMQEDSSYPEAFGLVNLFSLLIFRYFSRIVFNAQCHLVNSFKA